MKHPSMESLQDYFEGVAENALEKKLSAHLEVCDRCSEVLGEMAMVDRRFKSAPNPLLPKDFEGTLYEAVSPALKERRERCRRRQEGIERRGEFIQSLKGLGEFLVHDAKTPAIQVASLSALVLLLAQAQRFEEETVHHKLIDNEVQTFDRID